MRVILFLAIAVKAASCDGKPQLFVFKGPAPNGGPCRPCEQFSGDYRRSARFRQWLQHNFQIVPAYDSRYHGDKFKQWNVSQVPTFIVVDSSGELVRAVGYTTHNKLADQLIPRQQSRPKPKPAPNVSQRVAEANKALEAERDSLRRSVEMLQRDLADARKAGDDSGAAVIATLTAQIKALQLKLKNVQTTPADPLCKDGVCVPPPTDDSVPDSPEHEATGTPRGLFRSIMHHGLGFAADIGLTQAQGEIAVPLIAAGGPAGAAAYGAFLLWKRWRRRRTNGKTIVVDALTPPPHRQIETQFVNVENDSYQRAHEQARQHVVRRYPGSQEVLEAELSLTRQFLSGQKG